MVDYSALKEAVAFFLKCSPDQAMGLCDIREDISDVLERCKTMSIDGVFQLVRDDCVAEMKRGYSIAASAVLGDPELFGPKSAHADLEWDPDLLVKAIRFLDPEKDIQWSLSPAGEFILELDYWELYTSVIETVCDIVKPGSWNFKDVSEGFSDNFWGGDNVPAEFGSLIL